MYQLNEANSVVFVVSLSEFDQTCYEDNQTNRMTEGLEVVKQYIQIITVPCFIIFNKYDVLIDKIKRGVKFSQFQPEYTGDNEDVESVCKFIMNSYLQLDTTTNKLVKTFRISALDEAQVKTCFDGIVALTAGVTTDA